MKYTPIQPDRELVEFIRKINDCSVREATEAALKHVKQRNKELLIECIKEANSVEELKELMVAVVNSI